MSASDQELWNYFSILYKNSNKGIKGRGKDRRISTNSQIDKNMKPEARSRSSSSESSSSYHPEGYDIRLKNQDPIGSDKNDEQNLGNMDG